MNNKYNDFHMAGLSQHIWQKNKQILKDILQTLWAVVIDFVVADNRIKIAVCQAV